jgi:hypothetical protein
MSLNTARSTVPWGRRGAAASEGRPIHCDVRHGLRRGPRSSETVLAVANGEDGPPTGAPDAGMAMRLRAAQPVNRPAHALREPNRAGITHTATPTTVLDAGGPGAAQRQPRQADARGRPGPGRKGARSGKATLRYRISTKKSKVVATYTGSNDFAASKATATHD